LAKLKCIVCGKPGEIHHVLTQKAYPSLREEAWNRCPLCREHHTMWHSQGIIGMAEKFFQVKVWIKNNGWTYCETKKKYVPQTYVKEEEKEI
jgi:hypothetical protein